MEGLRGIGEHWVRQAFRIDKSKHFVEKSDHINGIEAFRSFTKNVIWQSLSALVST